MMRFMSLIILTFVIIMGIGFSILNSEMVTVNYGIGTKSFPLSILMLGVWIFGILIGLLATYPKLLKLKMALRRLSHLRD